MKHIALVVGLLLDLWLGGLVHQLLSVMWLFRVLPREQAAATAASLFVATERAVLIVGGLTLPATFAWMQVGRSRLCRPTL